jgi:hypothetical protein
MLTSRSPKIEPSACQCGMMRENIQQVSADSSCSRHFSEQHKCPRSSKSNNGQLLLQCLAIEHHCCNAEGAREICSPKTILRTVLSVVRLYIPIGQKVVEKVPPDLTDNSTNDRSKVEERGMGVVEEVRWWANELRNSCDDADGPSK